jgi:hypothetical protein
VEVNFGNSSRHLKLELSDLLLDMIFRRLVGVIGVIGQLSLIVLSSTIKRPVLGIRGYRNAVKQLGVGI